MMGWILLFVAFLFVVTLRAVAGKFLPHPRIPIWMRLVLFSILISGALLTIHSISNLSDAWQRKEWPITPGRIIKAVADTSGTIRPMVFYTYEISGRAYIDSTDLQAPGFGNRAKQYEVAEELVRLYPVGKEIAVHYDPDESSNSVLITNPSWRIYGQLGLGVILFAGALFFLILPRPKNGIAPN